MLGQTTSYRDTLLANLDKIEYQFTHVLDLSSIQATNLPSNFIGFPRHGWAPSNDELTAARIATLRNLRDFEPRFRLLFAHATPEVAKRLDAGFGHLYRWLDRDTDDHSIPATIQAARVKTAEVIEDLRSLTRLLPDDDWPTRLVVDTNALVDNPDLTIYATTLGQRYMVHALPVMLGELDDLKRAGRNPEVRDAARRADRRLKALRDNGNVRVGARVAGDIHAVFEHTEPGGDGLPSWLDLTVPDDRLVASVLLLQSAHPGSTVHVATSDLNLQTKLAAVGLPHLEPPS